MIMVSSGDDQDRGGDTPTLTALVSCTILIQTQLIQTRNVQTRDATAISQPGRKTHYYQY